MIEFMLADQPRQVRDVIELAAIAISLSLIIIWAGMEQTDDENRQ